MLALGQPEGLAELERKLGIQVPPTVADFWATLWLVRFADAKRWADFLEEEPRLIHWTEGPFLLVNSHPHSVMVGGVLLNLEEDPPIFCGWEPDLELDPDGDREPMQQMSAHFSRHLLACLRE